MERTVNEIVQQARWDADLTQYDIAYETGYSVPYICMMESGLRRVPEAYWTWWVEQGVLKAEDYTAYQNLPERIKGVEKV